MNAYLLLGLSAFGAATILPFYSEVVLLAMLEAGKDPFGLWLAAGVGNTLGSVVNWAIGWHIDRVIRYRWCPVNEAQLARGREWFARYGHWSLLLAWLPVGGDAITFVGGIMRVPLSTFVLLVGFGKFARYAVLILGWGAVA
ncbi:MAG: YqaA family protein [Halieaceae bacterium]|nr:YqaA family protein [Halieaceae bacterium]